LKDSYSSLKFTNPSKNLTWKQPLQSQRFSAEFRDYNSSYEMKQPTGFVEVSDTGWPDKISFKAAIK